MLDKLAQLEQIALAELQDIQDEDELQRWKVANLGRSSGLMKTFDQLGSLPKDERPLIGRRANEVKRALEGAFDLRAESLAPGCC